jgi:2-amino-4-hydroxy-6-hydroxymethyldihydropteridine diphosphokinase
VILVGIGGNLTNKIYKTPVSACEAALEALSGLDGVKLLKSSPWYKSQPVPISEQPWYINGVAEIDTPLEPAVLLTLLHQIEERFGRVRSHRNAPRIIDLDLLAYNDAVIDSESLQLPHPRLHLRSFVLFPLRDMAAEWRHPRSGLGLSHMIETLPRWQICVPLND